MNKDNKTTKNPFKESAKRFTEALKKKPSPEQIRSIFENNIKDDQKPSEQPEKKRIAKQRDADI